MPKAMKAMKAMKVAKKAAAPQPWQWRTAPPWYKTGEWTGVNVGGNVENIYVKKNTQIWCGHSGGKWMHPGSGAPNNWFLIQKVKEKVKHVKKATFKKTKNKNEEKVNKAKKANFKKSKNNNEEKVKKAKKASFKK